MKKLMLFSMIICFQNILAFESSWHFYAPPVGTKQTITKRRNSSPKEGISLIKRRYEAVKARAILNPTDSNVKALIQYHYMINGLARRLADRWGEVSLKYISDLKPAFSTSSTYGVDFKDKAEEEKTNNAIQRFSKSGGLVYLYKGNCPYCMRFSPIVKSFSELNHIEVRAVSCDGVIDPEWPQSVKASQEQCSINESNQVPAIFAAIPGKRKLVQISKGLVAHDELKKNMVLMLEMLDGGRL